MVSTSVRRGAISAGHFGQEPSLHFTHALDLDGTAFLEQDQAGGLYKKESRVLTESRKVWALRMARLAFESYAPPEASFGRRRLDHFGDKVLHLPFVADEDLLHPALRVHDDRAEFVVEIK